MSTFKSFAQQGSSRDYQLQAPDQTAKIEKETARTIRGRQRAQNFLERNQDLYLRAQKLAQGVEENQREQNFKLETENRQAFKDALDRDYKIQTRNDEIRAKQSQELYKSIMPLAKSAGELFVAAQKVDLERNQKINAELAYTAGADYKTVIAIQSLGDNLTKSEFAQTEFMRQKLAAGGNLDALFALYERRASKAFINNIAVAQNTAFAFHDASLKNQEEFLKANPGASIEEQHLNSKVFEREFAASLRGVNGRALNSDMLNQYVFPTIRRSQTQFNSYYEKLKRKNQAEIVKQNQFKELNHQWNTSKSAGVMEWLTTNPSKEKFEVYAEWVRNKSLDFSKAGLQVADMERLRDYQYEGPNFKQTGERTTYGLSREAQDDYAVFTSALEARRRGERQRERDYQTDAKRDAQAASIDFYNEAISDGEASPEELAEQRRRDAATGFPGFESDGAKLLAQNQNTKRFEAIFEPAFQKATEEGNLTIEMLMQKGVSQRLKDKYLPLLEKQNLLTQTEAYKTATEDIKRAITDGHPMVVRGRSGTSRDHWTTNRMVAKELQIFKQEVLKSQDPSKIDMIASGRITVISANQQKPGYINEKGHYTLMSQETETEAKEYRAMLLEDNKFLDDISNPNFKEASVAVNVYGENNFYEDYYPMQRGEVTARLRRRSAAMGMSPLAAINFLASGVGQQPVAADAQVKALMEKVAPLQRLTNYYRESGSYNSRLNRGFHVMNNMVYPRRSSFEQPLSPGMRGLAELVSSGEGAADSMFPSENHPEMLNMEIRTELVNFQKQKLSDGRASAAVGMFQFLHPEVAADLAGLPPDAKFTPENQYKMFVATVLNKPGRENLSAYLRGESDDIEAALDDFANEWSSFAGRDGQTAHKDGVNKATITRDKLRSALMSAREDFIKSYI